MAKADKSGNSMNNQSDPAEHSVEEVIEYLDSDISDEEKLRVLEAEENGKNRVTIVNHESAPPDPSKDNEGPDASVDKGNQEDTPEVKKGSAATPDGAVGVMDPDAPQPEPPQPGDDDYDPATDPDVPSSTLGDQIAMELKSGQSPTLEALKDAKADSEKSE